jgi:hypothetical protein
MSMKQKLQAAREIAGSWLPDALLTAGAGAVSCGAGMVYLPAGWIVAGLFALAGGWLLARAPKAVA